MIFLGDVSIPYGVNLEIPDLPWSLGQTVVANLEGDVLQRE
jgi:hypothetical protein